MEDLPSQQEGSVEDDRLCIVVSMVQNTCEDVPVAPRRELI